MTAAFVVVNPAAGGGRTARAWPALRDALAGAGLAFTWAATRGRGEGVALARAAVGEGADLVVAVGGDGTLNEVVNGVTGDDGRPLAAVGALLTGRGRDACRNLGLAADPRLAVPRLLQSVEAVFDLGLAEWPDGRRRYFVGAAGAGFDAAVAARAAAGGGRGTLPYLCAVAAALWSHRPRDAEVAPEGAPPRAGPITMAVAANGPCFGGGMAIAPGADPADGLLDVVTIGAVGRAELVRWLPAVYRGAHLAHPRVAVVRTRRVHVRGPAPLPTQVDGEPAPATPVSFAVVPRALRLRGVAPA